MLATWGTSTGRNPTLDLQFAGATSLDSRITFTRGSQATLFDSAGTLVFAPNNVIRNNTMVGAVAGTPGTLPTNWAALATAGGITREIVGIGTVDGISYIDIRYSGTTTNLDSVNLAFDGNTAVAASNGQSWTNSAYVTIVAGSLANISNAWIRITERTGAGSFVGSTEVSFASASGSLRLNRFSATRTLGATAGAVQGNIFLNIASGVAIDITLRIGMPQLERGSVATAVNATSGTAYYGPRFDYDPSTLAARGLLIEEQRTNVLLWSEQFDNAVWNKNSGGTIVTANAAVAPDGTTTADLVEDNPASGNSTWCLQPFTPVIGETYTFSLYVRAAGGSTFQLWIFNNVNGGVRTSTITATGAWQRYTLTATIPSGATDTRAGIDLAPLGGVYVWGAQVEAGAFPTSYIPTTTTALTRNADVASMSGTNFSSWYNAAEGTLLAQWSKIGSLNFQSMFGVSDNTANNVIILAHGSGAPTNNARFDVNVSGSSQASLTMITGSAVNTVYKTAGAYKANDFAAVAGGGAVQTDATGTVPTVTQAVIGTNGAANGGFLSGYIQRISYYPSRLPDGTLQALTA